MASSMVVLLLQNADSSVEIKVDGKTLDKGSSTKLKIGSKIDVGGQAEYQVRPSSLPLQGIHATLSPLTELTSTQRWLRSHMHQSIL